MSNKGISYSNSTQVTVTSSMLSFLLPMVLLKKSQRAYRSFHLKKWWNSHLFLEKPIGFV